MSSLVGTTYKAATAALEVMKSSPRSTTAEGAEEIVRLQAQLNDPKLREPGALAKATIQVPAWVMKSQPSAEAILARSKTAFEEPRTFSTGRLTGASRAPEAEAPRRPAAGGAGLSEQFFAEHQRLQTAAADVGAGAAGSPYSVTVAKDPAGRERVHVTIEQVRKDDPPLWNVSAAFKPETSPTKFEFDLTKPDHVAMYNKMIAPQFADDIARTREALKATTDEAVRALVQSGGMHEPSQLHAIGRSIAGLTAELRSAGLEYQAKSSQAPLGSLDPAKAQRPPASPLELDVSRLRGNLARVTVRGGERPEAGAASVVLDLSRTDHVDRYNELLSPKFAAEFAKLRQNPKLTANDALQMLAAENSGRPLADQINELAGRDARRAAEQAKEWASAARSHSPKNGQAE